MPKMQLPDLFAYFFMLLVLTLVPGPLTAVMMARTLAGDTFGAIFFGLGIALGDVLVICLLVLGLGAWLQSAPVFFEVSRILALAYILWLSWRVFRDDTGPQDTWGAAPPARCSDLCAGLLTCVMSPQTLLLYLVLLPALIDLDGVDLSTLSLVMTTTFAALATAFLAVITFAGWLRPVLQSRANRSHINTGLACLITVSGVWMGLS
jgi:threonine/homoserine/homoserine lactone efflux protein